MTLRQLHITKEQLEQALSLHFPYKKKAADHLNISYDTFRRRCIEYKIYNPSYSINRKTLTKDEVIRFIDASKNDMPVAAKLANKSYAAFKRHAKAYNVWTPTRQPNKNKKRPKYSKHNIHEILKGHHPTVSGSYVKALVLRHNIFPLECNICKISVWQNRPAPLQLDHINGNNTDHRQDNLRLLCANCHAQTPTFCTGNRNFYKLNKIKRNH